ncbi:MAG: hypothetical protein ACFFCH_11480 [Promethearchaeota archaeon]
MSNKKLEELVVRFNAAQDKAWWWDMTGLVGESDQQLAVIGPRSDATADDLRSLGKLIERWKLTFPQARHIWGLSDLLEGRFPRTPPIYLTVPYPLEHFEESYEPVALVYVAEETDIETAMKNLSEWLSDFQSKLAWLEHPDKYSYQQR